MTRPRTPAKTDTYSQIQAILRGLGIILIAGFLSAGQPAAAFASNSDTAEKRDLVSRMLVLTGGFELGLESTSLLFDQLKTVFEKMAPGKGEEIAAIVKEEFVIAMRQMQHDIENDIIKIYVKHFTIEELRAMLDFYATPVGVKTLQLLPVIMQDSQNVGLQYARKAQKMVGPRVQARIQALIPKKK